MNASAFLLRLQLLTQRAGAAACVAAALLIVGAAGMAWALFARSALQAAPATLPAAPAQLVEAAPPRNANENLAAFYEALGEKRYAEQQIRTLFGIAAKTNLSLDQGEYKFGYDKASRVSTYQINLPVRGPYANIWQFSMQALAAMPFASLDEVNFRRDTITDPVVEARLRFTLYLKDTGVQP
ncbi:hypothetical protein [Pseudoduganella sp. RAF53_2]|uniref:hypothetical protein n=1 Tax=unclassified Pseudoduganella TaxID=2637179 RepID=UPI003F9964C4